MGDTAYDEEHGMVDDDVEISLEHTVLTRTYRVLGALLVATLAMPYARIDDANVFVLAYAAASSGMDVVRAFWPGVVGLGLIAVSFLGRLPVRTRAAIVVGLLLSLPLLGPSPAAAFRFATPPVMGDVAAIRFNMLPGEFFPREGALHMVLLLGGLALLVGGARYRSTLQSSRLGAAVLGAGAVLVLAYYVVPYGGKVPVTRNVSLYTELYRFGETALAEFDRSVEEIEEYGYDTESVAAKRAIREGRRVGMIRYTSAAFLSIYLIPAALLLLVLPALWPSRYRGHRIPFAKLVGAAAGYYLLAFLLPLTLKDNAHLGTWVGLRELLLLVVFVPSLGNALALLLQSAVEPKKTDDALPTDPFSWQE